MGARGGRTTPARRGGRLRTVAPRGAPRHRPRSGRGFRPCPDPGRHRRPRAGSRRRCRALRPAARRPAGLRRGLRPLVAPSCWPRGPRVPALVAPPRRGSRRRGAGPGRDPSGTRLRARHDAAGGAWHAHSVGLERGRRGRVADRGRRDLAGRLFTGRGPAPSRVRPDDPGRAARGRAAGGPPGPTPRAPSNPPLRAPLPRPEAGSTGDAPAQPRDRRPAPQLGLATADPRAAIAGRPVRHLRLDGAPLAPAVAVHSGPVRGVGGAHGVVRVRDTTDTGHPADARP